jgi:hypothetical protein
MNGLRKAVLTDAWFERQLAHVRACLVVADKIHTPEELAAAESALAIPPNARQQSLFTAPVSA